jgi:cobalt-precorrin 5A hydrolase
MNRTAVITLSNAGARLTARLAREMDSCDLFLHADVARRFAGERFDAVIPLTKRIFKRYAEFVYIMPCGVVARALDGLPRHKTRDPAVVVVDVGGRWAVSLLSGHEGGANALALRVANALAAEPVITTTTEAVKDMIVGVGCRRGAPAADIVAAVREALRLARVRPARVRWMASADLKKNEAGLLAAAEDLGFGLRFISADEIRGTAKAFRHSRFVQSKVKLPAVAEPAALLAGRRTTLWLPKTIIHGVTVAVARENCL